MSELMQETEIRERFTVDNDMKAEWCLNKIRKAKEQQSREKAELQRQMQFYEDQMEIIDRKTEEEVSFFESMLREYFKSRVDEGFTKSTKTQTAYKLPTGKLVLKKQNPDYIRDDAVIIDWLKQNGGQFIKTKESLDWAELKKTVTVNGESIVTADGEIVPGVKVIANEDAFIVEV